MFFFPFFVLESLVGDPPPAVEDMMGSGREIGLCADFEDVQLDLHI